MACFRASTKDFPVSWLEIGLPVLERSAKGPICEDSARNFGAPRVLVANKVSAHHCARCVCDRLILGTGGAETGSPDDCFLRSVSLWDKDQLAFLSPTRLRTGRRIRRSASQVAARLLGQIQYFGGQAIVLDEKRSVRFQHVHEEF